MHLKAKFFEWEKACKSTTVIIAAAGEGRRFSSEQLKIMCPFVRGETVLESALRSFCVRDEWKSEFAKIILVISKKAAIQKLALEIEARFETPFEIELGGEERQNSVDCALENVRSDWVLIHDAARPLLKKEDLARVIEHRGELSGDGAFLATPVRDSLKRAISSNVSGVENCLMSQAVARQALWQTLTPQIFPTARLKKAMHFVRDKKIACGDEAEAIFFSGGKPKLVRGCWSNLKLTHPEDLAPMRWLARQERWRDG